MTAGFSYWSILVALTSALSLGSGLVKETPSQEPGLASISNKHTLKLASLFFRHGDRGPAAILPDVDKHKYFQDEFWPNGVHNLTGIGRLRSFRLGLENGRHYRDFVGINASQVMAFSSTSPRCIETAKLIIRGLLDVSQTTATGLRDLRRFSSTEQSDVSKSGSALEWQKVNVDIWTIPALTWRSAANCKYYKFNRPPVEENLLDDPEIRPLPGIGEIRDLMLNRYKLDKFGFDITDIHSIVTTELRIARTRDTFNYTDHFRDWVNKPVATSINRHQHNGGPQLTLFDVLDYVTLRVFVDRYEGGPRRLLAISPILKHLFDTQEAALSVPLYPVTNTDNSSKILTTSPESYKNKRLVIYTSHDDVLTAMFQSIGVIKFRGSFEHRFYENIKKSDLQRYLNGVQLPCFGVSFRMELFEVTGSQPTNQTNSKENSDAQTVAPFPYVKLSIYNQDDPLSPIRYVPFDLGVVCKAKFMQKYPKSARQVLETEFYKGALNIDRRRDCPLKLLRNITAHLLMPNTEWSKLC